ncbi:TetR/AcrR family transcriptional regulator [Streptomyces sp. NPDC050485]|uniref:TetR/AcrR family transcriptional regulator n=1 Tax=Streptomyces sp. NPDC050485 TaxID=3365617 RepID=UPI0037A40DC5
MATQKKGEGEPTLWERLERPSVAARTALSHRKIAEVAVAVADAEGFAAVTMRRLATELGVAPMAAYRYVSGKDDLWALMVDQVSAETAPAGAESGWREVLRAHALRTRTMMLNHPWLSQLPAPLFALTPNRMAAAERQLAALDGHGLDPDTMMAAFRAVSSFVQGFVQSEVAVGQYMKEQGWATGDEIRQGLAPQMTWLMGTGRYPVFQHYALNAAHKDDPAWEFELGLDCVLDGIAARLGI